MTNIPKGLQNPAYRLTAFYTKVPININIQTAYGVKRKKKKADSNTSKNAMSLINKISDFSKKTFHFLTYDIWRLTESEVTGMQRKLINLIKVVFLSIRRYNEDELQNKASALTYNTLLCIVPILAIFFGIARGFGLQKNLQDELDTYFKAQSDILNQLTIFIDSYLNYSKGGVFIGIGLIFLFFTAMGLISTIENSFNDIWQVKQGRTYWRKLTDYFSMLLILPILIISSSGLSIYISTQMSEYQFFFLDPLLKFTIKLSPYILSWILCTCTYIFLPNTKVKFKNALLAGIVTGTAFQIFQFFYINGQIWVSKYNAIFGGFAALPLLLLWLQLSWLIVLFGAELAFAGQNIENYDFETDTKHITHRYKDFLILVVSSVITKRFANGETAYTAEEITKEYNIPIRLTRQVLNILLEIRVIVETPDADGRTLRYQPAIDIHLLSIGYLFDKIERTGSENFKIDREHKFSAHWKEVLKIKGNAKELGDHVLIKDL